MMKHLTTIGLLLIIASFGSSCQTRQAIANANTAVTTIPGYIQAGDYKLVEVDKLNNIFLVDNNNEIIKLHDNEILHRFSSKRLGDITRLDVSNPQKILVYYGDYFQILFLDNTLSEINQLSLDELGYWDVQSVALSRDNFIWIYDPVNVKLIKISTSGKEILSSNELFDVGFDADISPTIKVAGSEIFLYDETELRVFDEFGVAVRTIPLEQDGLQAVKQGICYLRDNNLYLYPTEVQFKETEKHIVELGAVRQFSLAENLVHVIDERGYRVVTLN